MRYKQAVPSKKRILHGNIDQTLMNSLHGLLCFEIGGY